MLYRPILACALYYSSVASAMETQRDVSRPASSLQSSDLVTDTKHAGPNKRIVLPSLISALTSSSESGSSSDVKSTSRPAGAVVLSISKSLPDGSVTVIAETFAPKVYSEYTKQIRASIVTTVTEYGDSQYATYTMVIGSGGIGWQLPSLTSNEPVMQPPTTLPELVHSEVSSKSPVRSKSTAPTVPATVYQASSSASTTVSATSMNSNQVPASVLSTTAKPTTKSSKSASETLEPTSTTVAVVPVLSTSLLTATDGSHRTTTVIWKSTEIPPFQTIGGNVIPTAVAAWACQGPHCDPHCAIPVLSCSPGKGGGVDGFPVAIVSGADRLLASANMPQEPPTTPPQPAPPTIPDTGLPSSPPPDPSSPENPPPDNATGGSGKHSATGSQSPTHSRDTRSSQTSSATKSATSTTSITSTSSPTSTTSTSDVLCGAYCTACMATASSELPARPSHLRRNMDKSQQNNGNALLKRTFPIPEDADYGGDIEWFFMYQMNKAKKISHMKVNGVGHSILCIRSTWKSQGHLGRREALRLYVCDCRVRGWSMDLTPMGGPWVHQWSS